MKKVESHWSKPRKIQTNRQWAI